MAGSASSIASSSRPAPGRSHWQPRSAMPSRPVGFEGHGFVATPLDSGFRIGGAVEFGGLKAPPNHARTRRLYDKAAGLIDGLPPFDSGKLWMGFRPSLPDSL